MNQLFPILRRVRRPLVVEIKPPMVGGTVAPVKDGGEIVTPPKSVTPADPDEETAAE